MKTPVIPAELFDKIDKIDSQDALVESYPSRAVTLFFNKSKIPVSLFDITVA